MLGKAVGLENNSPGSEPYSADYGCIRGPEKGVVSQITGGLEPGLRWRHPQTKWADVPVVTPCPCALGVYTGLQGAQAAEGSSEMPAWQQGANSMLLGSAGPWAVLGSLALTQRWHAATDEKQLAWTVRSQSLWATFL
eukprot:gnl/TRDRNA2_/TRDRNA2_155722_c0_seq2.p1 gnl/TRDRNA2_/TRDRNA2_155722_c0~~gnl/TRDRNA2_/TRDRNA2_155722_c0_seq2.p1  ORF type:complete len:138 (+),score=10.89 gnl/TRDRNA2_/TRDRNA2_155722_c0_seq2:107-520(+)